MCCNICLASGILKLDINRNFFRLYSNLIFCIRRRDRGFFYRNSLISMSFEDTPDNYEKICYGNPTFNYYIPSILHFIGYIYAIYLFKISDNEQLQNLMERVSIFECM